MSIEHEVLLMPARKFNKKAFRKLLKNEQFDELRNTIALTDPADLADILEELDAHEVEQAFTILDNETASEVIVEMGTNDVEEVVEHMPADRLAGMLREMAPDDAADFFNELDQEDQDEILPYLNNKERQELKELTDYEEDSAGGLMTPELCAVSSAATVEQAIHAMTQADFSDPITMIFVVDNERHLVGAIHISELIAKPCKEKVADVADKDIITAHVDDSSNDIALDFRKYDLYVMPVVDYDEKLVGRITADDVMDVMDEEAAEDIAKLAGAPDIETKEDSPVAIVRLRLPWLMITMIAGTLVSLIIQKIVNINGAEKLAAFIPVILAMGGNTGMQASAVTIRSIALGEIELNHLMNIFSREFMVGAIMGVTCGVLTAMTVWINLTVFADAIDPAAMVRLMIIVGISMFVAMSFAAFTGTMLPIVLNQFKIDPALATGPFVTTGNDLSASLIYLVMCSILLN
ncbi:MAG: magnesium transporter [Victivallaceae bacterium]|nr:magnesium transporter [Victivallaceae bacterium]